MIDQQNFFERKENELGVSLNEVQKQGVLHTEGALLILASPGSGKTTTIIMRIGYLIEEKGVKPFRIKAITFSKASANDMIERFKRFFPYLPPVDFSTIHSLAFEIVREYLRKIGKNFHIIEGDLDEQELNHSENLLLHKKIILRNLYKSLTGETLTDDQMDELTTYISYIKNIMIPRVKWSSVKVDVPNAEKILKKYEEFKRENPKRLLLDYDDMLTIANKILEKDQEILRKYQQKYDYVLIDESQDTSLVQHTIIEKLVQQHGNLCLVGDDDQSIYSWRGAEPSYLLNFKNKYPDAKILFMEENYRSTKDIVNVANQFIKRNKYRYNKNMFTQNPYQKPIEIMVFQKYADQVKYLVQEIQKVNRLTEVAVLYRNNSSSISLMNEFDRAGIPFYMKDADNRFFSHWVVEDILNFMRMSYTDKRPDIFEKIHLKMKGYINKQQMEVIKKINNNQSVFDNLLQYVPLQDYQIKQIKECKETFQKMKGMKPLQAIWMIRGQLGYEKALEKTCERLGFRKDYIFGILNTLEEIARPLESMEQFAMRIKYLGEVLKKAKLNRGKNAVTLSTLHSSKGLEFERVFMIDLVDGIIPATNDIENEELMEEETRLFYVGMTRAKKQLELLCYQEKDMVPAKESLFVTMVRNILNPVQHKTQTHKIMQNSNSAHIITKQEQLKVGNLIKHKVFGKGTITNVNDEQLFVQFQTEQRILLIKVCLEFGLLESLE